MATFNALEAAVRWGVPRFVNLSSETVPGFFFPERKWLPDYVPVDEEHPIRPQDPYATAKHFGEQLMDGATRRCDITRRLDPAVLGAVGGQLRDATSARGCASRRRRRASGPTSTSTTSPTRSGSRPRRRRRATRSSTSPRPTSRRTSRSRRSARRFHGDAAPEIRPSDEERPERDLDRQGAPAARLRPAALVARLPRRRRPAAARGARAPGARRDRRAARPAAHRPAGWRLTKPAAAARLERASAGRPRRDPTCRSAGRR